MGRVAGDDWSVGRVARCDWSVGRMTAVGPFFTGLLVDVVDEAKTRRW